MFCAVMFSPARAARLSVYRQGVILVMARSVVLMTDGLTGCGQVPGRGSRTGDDGMIIDRSLSRPEFHRLTS